MRRRPWASAAAALTCVAAFTGSTAARPSEVDPLTYALTVVPGDLSVANRMPGVEYGETFSFTVANPTKTDFRGHAPTCQLFELMIMPAADTTPLWRSSTAQAFCQRTVDDTIASGKSWSATATWSFAITDVPDGTYRAVARFIPSGGRAVAEFDIASPPD